MAERRRDADGRCLGVRVGSLVEGDDERSALRFSAPLMTFAIEVIATLDRDDPAYVVDVISVVESVLDDPRQVLFAQQNAARSGRGRPAEGRGRAVRGAHRAAGVDHVAASRWPSCSTVCSPTYREHHPWVAEEPSPKSILREMLEGGDTFATFVRRYRLERSEGLVLRYLTDAWRTLDRSLPDDVYTAALEDVVEWLGCADPGHRRHAARRVGAAGRRAGARPPRARGARSAARRGRRRRGAPPCARPRSAGSSCWRPGRYAALADRSGWDRAAPGRGDGARTGPSTTPSAPTPTPARAGSSR